MAEKKKRQPNSGSFKKGPDPRRYRFTASDARVGWLVANLRHPHLRAWLKKRLCCFYHYRKEASHGQEEEGHRPPDGDIPF